MSKLKRWDFVQEVAAIYKLGLEVASREKIFTPFFFFRRCITTKYIKV